MKILIKEHKRYIKGYGFVSDLEGKTICGVDKELVQLLSKQGAELEEEFIEDTSIPKYEVNNLSIPQGVLKVYAVFHKHLYQI